MKKEKPKTRFTTKLYFWLFVLLMILAIFLFWSSRGAAVSENRIMGMSTNMFIAIAALCLSIFFGIICFIRFIRSRSIAGGLFLTTAISTGVFLGTSQLLPVVVPSTAAALSAAPEATNNGLELMLGLAQIGLFAIWYGFLLLTMYMHLRPVKKIDRYLQRIMDGEDVKRVRIGKAKQYCQIAEKIKTIADARTQPLTTCCAQEVDETQGC